jgi:hypothetical protein
MASSTSRPPVRSVTSRVPRLGSLLLAVLGAIVLSACGTADSREATGVTADGATLQGAVSADRDEQVTYWFEYGTTTAYGTETARRTMSITDRVPHRCRRPSRGCRPRPPITSGCASSRRR